MTDFPLERFSFSTRRSFCRSAPIEGQSSASSSVETNSLKSIEKQNSIDENPELLMDAILEKDKELARVLQEKELLLGRLLNLPASQSKDSPGSVSPSATRANGFRRISAFQVGSTSMSKANSSLEAITYAASCRTSFHFVAQPFESLLF